MKKIGVHWQEYVSSLKFDFPQISVILSISRKDYEIKKILFPVDKKLIFTSRNEGLAEKYVPVEEKMLPLAAGDCCLRKWKKMVSTSQKPSFH